MKIYRIIGNLLIGLGITIIISSCASVKYKAKTKADLAKLCTYEFPYTGKVLEQKIDTLIIHNIVHERIDVECDTIGVKTIYIEVPNDTIIITETNEVESSSQSFYISDLEFSNEKLEEAKETSDKRYKRLWGWIIAVVGFGGLILYIFKR